MLLQGKQGDARMALSDFLGQGGPNKGEEHDRLKYCSNVLPLLLGCCGFCVVDDSCAEATSGGSERTAKFESKILDF